MRQYEVTYGRLLASAHLVVVLGASVLHVRHRLLADLATVPLRLAALSALRLLEGDHLEVDLDGLAVLGLGLVAAVSLRCDARALLEWVVAECHVVAVACGSSLELVGAGGSTAVLDAWTEHYRLFVAVLAGLGLLGGV